MVRLHTETKLDSNGIKYDNTVKLWVEYPEFKNKHIYKYLKVSTSDEY